MKKLSRLTKVSLLLAILFTIDKALGVFRQMLISRQFQLSAELDVFNAANNLPDMLFNLISGGVLAIAFIPVLSEVLSKDGQKKAWNLFSNVLNIAFIATAVLAVLVALFAEPIIRYIIAPGFSEAQVALAVELMRLNLISTLIFSISGFMMAGLQANQHFFLPAMAPILYDLGQIFGAMVLAPSNPTSLGPITFPALGFGVKGLAYGVILGALLHLLIQIPGLIKYKFNWKPSLDLNNPETRKVFRLMGPRLISMVCIQMIFLMQDNLASRIAQGSVSALTYGWWIMQVPETLIGTAIATAILPTLAELFSEGAHTEFKQRIERAGKVMLSLTIPIAVISSVVLLPVIQRFLGLEAADTLRVTQVSRVFLFGIIGHSLVELFVRSYYAMQKPKVPTIMAVVTFLAYLLLGVVLMGPFKESGIAAANTLAYAIQAVVLYVLLRREFKGELQMAPSLIAAVVGAVAGGLVAWAAMRFLPGLAGGLIAAILAFGAGIIVAAFFVRKSLVEMTNL